jgi:hypothetical protein
MEQNASAEVNIRWDSQEIPLFLWNRKFIPAITRALTGPYTQPYEPCFPEIHFNIIIRSTYVYSKLSLSFRRFYRYSYAFLKSPTLTTFPAHHIVVWFIYSGNVWCAVKMTNVYIVIFSSLLSLRA